MERDLGDLVKDANGKLRRPHFSLHSGHLERSEHWKAVRRLVPDNVYSPRRVDMEWLLRRSMNRVTRSGK